MGSYTFIVLKSRKFHSSFSRIFRIWSIRIANFNLPLMHNNIRSIGCLQWRKFGRSVDGQVGRKSIHWIHFENWRHFKSRWMCYCSVYLASTTQIVRKIVYKLFNCPSFGKCVVLRGKCVHVQNLKSFWHSSQNQIILWLLSLQNCLLSSKLCLGIEKLKGI